MMRLNERLFYSRASRRFERSFHVKFKLELKTLNYVLLDRDLYNRGVNGFLHKCIKMSEPLKIMTGFHRGLCGSRRADPMMNGLCDTIVRP